MQYHWNKYELLLKRQIAQLLHNEHMQTTFNIMLDSYDLSKTTVSKEQILLASDKDKINYQDSYLYFSSGLKYIPTTLYQDMVDIFSFVEDLNTLNGEPVYEHVYFSDDELITFAHDIIKSMNNPLILKEFNNLLHKLRHILNIQKVVEDKISSPTEALGGITFYDELFYKSYINIFRNYTIEDVEILTHECLHAIFFKLFGKANKIKRVPFLLQELEGQFASQLSARYLDSIGLSTEANKLHKYFVDAIFCSSFLLLVNHLLFATSTNEKFDFTKLNTCLEQYFKNIRLTLSESELPTYLTIQGFNEATEMLSSLAAMDLLNMEEDMATITNKMINLKQNDGTDIFTNFENNGITFYQDGYKNLAKEYVNTHK